MGWLRELRCEREVGDGNQRVGIDEVIRRDEGEES